MSDDTERLSNDDSVVSENNRSEITDDGVLHVYQTGALTVLGFAGRDVPTDFNVAHYRAAILQLVEDNNCGTVAFDLTGVRIVPSGILGLWASLNQAEIKVEVYNPSEDIREVLEITKLNQLIEVREVEL